MVTIDLKELTKRFGEVVACDDIDLHVEDGELFTLLGPSGCGKTTILRCIAGFYTPEEGQIFFDETNITRVPPNNRNTGMVFQNYAIWPHMKVFDNVAFGLKIRKIPKVTIRKKVEDILELVRLGGLAGRTPFQLSGGQQQRVALARALVIEPTVLLLDEPLSNLDAKLRLEMRHEIKRIQKEFGITTIYVTHDQEEALSISDRIAVMQLGKIMQVDSPREIYEEPHNLFVADFIGSCTFIPGTIKQTDSGKPVIETPWGLELKGRTTSKDVSLRKGEEVYVAIRPEDFKVRRPTEPFNVIPSTIESVVFTGRYYHVYADVGGTNSVNAELDPDTPIKIGDKKELHVNHSDAIILKIEDDPFASHIKQLLEGKAIAK
ncbi:MAG: ABC transporter ATP-binding protein [Candidatus Hermodarchaeota archaeon]|nr:ABC transporter ATP-binding protein [Candidatus Hermodarchaeota archaeon]